MLEPEALAFAFVAIFLAGLVQAMTGFGFGIVAVPILALVVSPKEATPLTILEALALNGFIVLRTHTDVEARRISPLLIAGLAGLPIGTWLVVNLDVDALRIYVGIATIVVTLAFILRFQRQVAREAQAMLPVGFASGIMHASINMAGPPVILFLTNQGLPRHIFRATIVAYFFVLGLFSLPFLIATGVIDWDTVAAALIVSPSLVLGGITGTRLIPYFDEAAVRRFTLIIVLAAGIVSVLSGAGAW